MAIHFHSLHRGCIEELGEDGSPEISGRQGSERPNDRNTVSCRSSTKFPLIDDLCGRAARSTLRCLFSPHEGNHYGPPRSCRDEVGCAIEGIHEPYLFIAQCFR